MDRSVKNGATAATTTGQRLVNIYYLPPVDKHRQWCAKPKTNKNMEISTLTVTCRFCFLVQETTAVASKDNFFKRG